MGTVIIWALTKAGQTHSTMIVNPSKNKHVLAKCMMDFMFL